MINETKNKIKIIFITTSDFKVLQSIHSEMDNFNYEIIGVVESTKEKIEGSALYLWCQKQKINYFCKVAKCDEGFQRWIEELGGDLLVVNGMYELLKESIFTIPRLGSINYHPALLPKYRGPIPMFWVYYNQESEAGGTLHFINQGEDIGDIILQEKIEVPIGFTEEEYRENVHYRLASKLILEGINAITNGNYTRRSQIHEVSEQRANKILPSQYTTIIQWNEMPTLQVWHILCGCLSWLHVFEGEQIVELIDYEICGEHEKLLGHLYSIKEAHKRVYLKDGYINLYTRPHK